MKDLDFVAKYHGWNVLTFNTANKTNTKCDNETVLCNVTNSSHDFANITPTKYWRAAVRCMQQSIGANVLLLHVSAVRCMQQRIGANVLLLHVPAVRCRMAGHFAAEARKAGGAAEAGEAGGEAEAGEAGPAAEAVEAGGADTGRVGRAPLMALMASLQRGEKFRYLSIMRTE